MTRCKIAKQTGSSAIFAEVAVSTRSRIEGEAPVALSETHELARGDWVVSSAMQGALLALTDLGVEDKQVVLDEIVCNLVDARPEGFALAAYEATHEELSGRRHYGVLTDEALAQISARLAAPGSIEVQRERRRAIADPRAEFEMAMGESFGEHECPPVPFDETYTFHPILVQPFYLDLMNAGLLARPKEKRDEVVEKLRQTLPLFSDDDIRGMLRSSWRPAKVAAWVIAARRDESFIPDLERHMKATHYMEHACIALATLGSAQALGVLQRYLRSILPPEKMPDCKDEAVSPDWALAAIELIKPEAFHQWTAPTGPWTSFLREIGYGFEAHWQRRLQQARERLPQAVALIRNELGAGREPGRRSPD